MEIGAELNRLRDGAALTLVLSQVFDLDARAAMVATIRGIEELRDRLGDRARADHSAVLAFLAHAQAVQRGEAIGTA
jgi:hypothetical protein